MTKERRSFLRSVKSEIKHLVTYQSELNLKWQTWHLLIGEGEMSDLQFAVARALEYLDRVGTLLESEQHQKEAEWRGPPQNELMCCRRCETLSNISEPSVAATRCSICGVEMSVDVEERHVTTHHRNDRVATKRQL